MSARAQRERGGIRERPRGASRAGPPVHLRYPCDIDHRLSMKRPAIRSRNPGSYSHLAPRTTSTTLARPATFDLPARRVRTSWVTRFRLFATWNEVSALSEAVSRVRSDLNIATCLRRRSRKVWDERNGHFEAPTMDRLRWRYSWRTDLRPTCVTVTLSCALIWRGPYRLRRSIIRLRLRTNSFPLFL